jgi:replicative DNA helicase
MSDAFASTESERLLLSAFLSDPVGVGSACIETGLSSGDFIEPSNGSLYKFLLGIYSDGGTTQRYVITKKLKEAGWLEMVGGNDRLQELFMAGGLPVVAKDYAETVLDRSRRRVLASTMKGALTELEGGTPTHEVNQALTTAIEGVRGVDALKMLTPDQMTNEVIDRAVSESAVTTGFASLDHFCGPVYRGDFLVIGGKRKAGKSILAANIALNIARKQHVAYFTIEMNRAELWKRALCAESGVAANYWKPSWTHDADAQAKMDGAVLRMRSRKITVFDSVMDIEQVAAVARMVKAKYGDLGAVVIDYIQLFGTTGLERANRSEVVSHISRSCKRIATGLQCVAIGVCQLNDDGQSLDSRGIERDCNMMLNVEQTNDDGGRRVVCAFNRNGPMGCELRMVPELHRCRFVEP